MRAVYVYVNGDPNNPDRRGVVARTEELEEERVLVDYDAQGHIYGIEVLGGGPVTEERDGVVTRDVFNALVTALSEAVDADYPTEREWRIMQRTWRGHIADAEAT